MRIICMGTPDFAVYTLEALLAAGHDICLVVTQPDKPVGRGKSLQEPPVKQVAKQSGIPVFQPVKMREPENVEVLRSYAADVMVVVAFGQILSKEILEMCPFGCINVHASLLPAYRGAAPIQWAILKGEELTGVTTMQMDEGVDTGDMLLKTEIPITPTDTGASLHDKLAKAGGELAVETLQRLQESKIDPTPQGKTTTPYAKMLTKEMGNINWQQTAKEIERLVRAFHPWPCAYSFLDGKLMKIWQVEVGCEIESVDNTQEREAPPGQIVLVGKEYFRVQTGAGVLQIKEVQLAGKKRMSVGEFLRGHKIEVGQQFKGGN